MKGMKFSFKKLFGSRKSSSVLPGGPLKVSSSDNATHKSTLDRLREMEDLLQKKQAHLEQKIEEQLNEARKFGKKNKRAALMALKRKRRMEEELKKVDGTLTTIELQREALEAARNNVQVLGAMRDAAGVLKNAQKYVTVDKVLDIMDEVNEQQELAKEIADAISNPLSRMDSAADDAELERELEELEQEELDKQLLDVHGGGRTLGGESGNVGGSTKWDEKAGTDTNAAAGSSGASSAQNNKKQAGSRSSLNTTKTAASSATIDPDEKELQELAQWSALS